MRGVERSSAVTNRAVIGVHGKKTREETMFVRISMTGLLGAAMMLACGGAWAFDDSNYPDLKGQWNRMEVPGIGPSFDPTKRPGLAQQAPLTPEYQKILEASLACQRQAEIA